MTATPDTTVVDFWFDPVCPYSWTASRWLNEVELRRPLQVRHHVMSLYLLNEHRTDISEGYRQIVQTSRGPARVATAAAVRFGEEVLGRFYTAFGELVFDRWRYLSRARTPVARFGRRYPGPVFRGISRTPWTPTSTTRSCA